MGKPLQLLRNSHPTQQVLLYEIIRCKKDDFKNEREMRRVYERDEKRKIKMNRNSLIILFFYQSIPKTIKTGNRNRSQSILPRIDQNI